MADEIQYAGKRVMAITIGGPGVSEENKGDTEATSFGEPVMENDNVHEGLDVLSHHGQGSTTS